MAQPVDRDVVPRVRTGIPGADRSFSTPTSGGEGWDDPALPFRYRAYGLTVLSAFECPAFAPLPAFVPLPALSSTDGVVTIRTGAIPAALDLPPRNASGYTAVPGRLHLWIEGVADFLALSGTTIVVDPAPGSDPTEVRAYVLGSMLGTILHQRGAMVLHGSAVETPAGAVAFVADHGVGKSTLAAAMYRAGYPLLTDDLCAVRCDPHGAPWVAPGPYRVKLAPKTAAHLGLDAAAGLPLGGQRGKRSFALRDGRPIRTPLAAVCALEVGSGAPRVEPLDVHGAYWALLLYTYRREWVGRLGVQGRLFEHAVRILAQVPIYRLVRPDAGLNTDALVRLIEEVLAR